MLLSIQKSTNTIEGHLKPKFGKYQLKAITSAILQEYANDLKMNGLSKSHITAILSVNPMCYVKCPKVGKKSRERIILTLEE